MGREARQKAEVYKLKDQNKTMKKETKGLRKAFSPLFRIRELFRAPDGKKQAPMTVQSSLPFLRLTRTGILQISPKEFSKTIEFDDLNYELAKEEEQFRIFKVFAELINSFDTQVMVQLSLVNQTGYLQELADSIVIPPQKDAFNPLRAAYSDYLQRQLEAGNSGIRKRKFLTFTVQADNLELAKALLNRIEADSLKYFQRLQVKAKVLEGEERLQLLYELLNEKGLAKPKVSFEDLKKGYISSKDIIAPSSLDFRDTDRCKVGKQFVSTQLLRITANELSDRMQTEFLAVPGDIRITRFLQSIPQEKAIRKLKNKLLMVNQVKVNEQMKAVRQGYDYELIPTDLKTYSEALTHQLHEVQNQDEKSINHQFLLTVTEENEEKLQETLFLLQSIAQKYTCQLMSLDYQQEQALFSSLPLGKPFIPLWRGMDTSSVSILVPFSSSELFQSGESLYYGINSITKNLVMADRKQLFNGNGLFLGMSGSGKSFAAKREIANVILRTGDDVLICDPQNEYAALTNLLGGQVVSIRSDSPHYLNPMDVNQNYSGGESFLNTKAEFMLSLFEMILGRSQELLPEEKSIIDDAVRKSYEKYINNGYQEEDLPILEDVYNLLKKNKNEVAQYLAGALKLYVHGSLSIFNHHTNVNLEKRLVCYDISQLGTQLKNLGMLIVQDQVYNRVTRNQSQQKYTRYYVDEIHLLLKNPMTAYFTVRVYKEFRKYGGIPTGMTQNVKDFLMSQEVENILENTPFILMLSQAEGDKRILQEKLNISDSQLNYVTFTGPGRGLLFYENIVVPFQDDFPKEHILYSVLTTKPADLVVR